MAKNTILNSVEEVIEDFRNGKPVIVVDDEDRLGAHERIGFGVVELQPARLV